jgi:exopolysaccharide production protein ExoZ
VLEFAFGMWIAVAYRAGLRVPAGAAAALVVAGCGLALLYSPEASPALRALFWGVPMAMVLAGAVLSRRADGLATRLLARLGDASYSLYLLHFIVLLAWSRLWLAAGWDAARAPLLYAGAVLVIAGRGVAPRLPLLRAAGDAQPPDRVRTRIAEPGGSRPTPPRTCGRD